MAKPYRNGKMKERATGAHSSAVPARQQQVLDLLLAYHPSGRMEATAANYKRISDTIGWGSSGYRSVETCLRALRHRGKVLSVGSSMVRPEAWVVKVTIQDAEKGAIR